MSIIQDTEEMRRNNIDVKCSYLFATTVDHMREKRRKKERKFEPDNQMNLTITQHKIHKHTSYKIPLENIVHRKYLLAEISGNTQYSN